VQLSFAFGSNERSQPLLDGSVRPVGVDLTLAGVSSAEIFWRQLAFQEFDVSEMSLSSLLITIARGDSPWWGLPVFTTRHFFHTWGYVRRDAGIETPADLSGKRVGVPEYQQTAALWTRGIFEHEFGVPPSAIHWYMERPPERSHGGATGFRPPPGVDLTYIPRERNMGEMMLAGELDATIIYIGRASLMERSTVDLAHHPAIRPMFPDAMAEGVRYYRTTGIFPINHTVVVRRSLVEQHPWLALNLCQAFEEAKALARARLRGLLDPYSQLGLVPDESRQNLATDLYPYGVRANRQTLETVTRYSHEQGLTPRLLALDEVFAPSTLEL
jgi:4,5-dihydroxyphthalate decarboxylase